MENIFSNTSPQAWPILVYSFKWTPQRKRFITCISCFQSHFLFSGSSLPMWTLPSASECHKVCEWEWCRCKFSLQVPEWIPWPSWMPVWRAGARCRGTVRRFPTPTFRAHSSVPPAKVKLTELSCAITSAVVPTSGFQRFRVQLLPLPNGRPSNHALRSVAAPPNLRSQLP